MSKFCFNKVNVMNCHIKCLFVLISCCVSVYASSQNVEAVLNMDKMSISQAFNLTNHLRNDQAPCKIDKDCKNYGRCTASTEDKGAKKFCKCRRGTSGDFCQFIDECVLNPGFCGHKTNAKCVYDFQLGRANCQCQDLSKKFDFRRMMCRKPCKSYDQCRGSYIGCNMDDYYNKFCACSYGKRGDFCEIDVDECEEQGLECREAGAECDFNNKKQANCRCKNGMMRFDRATRQCRECDCGHSWYCDFVRGEKVCRCENGYYQSEGYCKECRCKRDLFCDGCKIENGQEICLCKEGRVQKGYSCEKPCSSQNQCQNGGTCIDCVCHCLPKFSGSYCETYDDCREICGGHPNWISDDYRCRYDVEKRRPICICSNERRKFNAKKGYCVDCDCGMDGVCSFNATGDKQCQCNKGYLPVKGTCQKCDCGRMSSECSFDGDGKKLCLCVHGYFQEGGMCLP